MLCVLFLFSFDGPIVWQIRNDEFSEYVSNLYQIAVTSLEEVYVLDSSEQRIYHLNADGKEVASFGRKGDGPGEMRNGYQIQYVEFRPALYVTDWSNPDLAAFSPDGKPLPEKIPRPSSPVSPVVLDPHRLVYIKGPDFRSQKNQGAKIILENWQSGEKRVLLTNDAAHHQDPATIANQNGRIIMDFPWYAKSLMAVSPDCRILVMGSNMDLDFQVWGVETEKMVGRIQATDAPRPPLLDEELEANNSRARLGSKVYTTKDFPHPDFKPPILEIFCDTQHRVWVQLMPAWKAENHDYRIFSPDGKLLGTFHLPRNVYLAHISRDHLWVSYYDREEDYWYLQKRTYQLAR